MTTFSIRLGRGLVALFLVAFAVPAQAQSYEDGVSAYDRQGLRDRGLAAMNR